MTHFFFYTFVQISEGLTVEHRVSPKSPKMKCQILQGACCHGNGDNLPIYLPVCFSSTCYLSRQQGYSR